MGEFDKLKDDAEQYGQQHPQQVKEGEQSAEKALGIQPGNAQPGNAQPGNAQPGNAQPDQAGPASGSGDHDQDSAGQ